ncbi:MAG TPA: choice-of-anchor Q domain-containing protein, partial [Rudaea sp.]|nr:choice-of-anchor Q domain-containing protein [Rudaea sp.]
NLGTSLVGGMWTNAGTIDVKNSTVAFNSAGSGAVYSKHYSPGFNIDDLGAYYTDISHYEFKVVTLQSSVFSNNVSGTSTTTADDFGITRFSNLNLVGVSGQNNLVFAAGYNTALPQATVTLGVCPLLGPLRDNGGGTKTHALSSGSFAIDHGNNTVPISVDQRGSPFLRVSGAAADIGAYEVQQADVIFNNGHEGCS